MSDCKTECIFNCDNECWFACKEKIKTDAIREFADWLPKHFDLRFSNNPQVWVDEYFNHTSEKVIKQLKGQK